MIRALLILAQIYPANLSLGRYFNAAFDDPVSRLDRRLAGGAATLEFRAGPLGYLPSLLEHLDINPDSQALVFSKTSFQARRIGPRNPRAIYFNDSVAVGFVPGGEVIELAALDPREGIAFYTLETRTSDHPRFAHREVCLSCHHGPATLGVPGVFVGSVHPDGTGMPQRDAAIITDHRTAFRDRWGGWYVDAARGRQKDRSNAVAIDPAEPGSLQPLPRFQATEYLAPHSDIVALMTFEHQTHMTNLLTRLNWLTRIGEPSAIDAALRETVAYMTFEDEAPLLEPVEGASSFANTFAQRGPRDRKGRSLRDFDLKTRLFRYPLSYMIHSEAFDVLPLPIRRKIYRALEEKLPPDALQILRETKPDVL
ncbi:MAG TPA: hypothetical protein VMH28_07375 [Candidatus Acidoferrales bacterium]|nr:hypothetical protein [Candidatus Acidoferrales bacterium]